MSDTSDVPRPRKYRHSRASSSLAVAVVVVGFALVVATTVFVALRTAHSPPAFYAASVPAAAALPAIKFAVVATTPSGTGTTVASDTTVNVSLSAPIGPSSPLPRLSPPVPGTWQQLAPADLLFTPDQPFAPGSEETLTVPAGTGGLVSEDGGQLATPTTTSFTIADGSTLRLQQLLAMLGYLPLSFTPTGPSTQPDQMAEPQEGTFAWRWTPPPSLVPLWTPGQETVVTKGAIMAFEDVSGLTTDGASGPKFWSSLLAAAAGNQVDPEPYDYVHVAKDLPETATVFRGGSEIYSTLANTGVPGAPTADGTFPVFSRFRSATMTGKNPDGTHYSDPGIPWISYFNGGDALHGFIRYRYGYPQSDGCVEMPPDHAAVVWPLTPIGTLVTVQ